jgi:ZIP Zinc transporter
MASVLEHEHEHHDEAKERESDMVIIESKSSSDNNSERGDDEEGNNSRESDEKKQTEEADDGKVAEVKDDKTAAASDMLDENSEANKKLQKMGLNTALAIGLHNFPEGLATFVAALEDPAVGAVLAVAIAIHNIPEGKTDRHVLSKLNCPHQLPSSHPSPLLHFVRSLRGPSNLLRHREPIKSVPMGTAFGCVRGSGSAVGMVDSGQCCYRRYLRHPIWLGVGHDGHYQCKGTASHCAPIRSSRYSGHVLFHCWHDSHGTISSAVSNLAQIHSMW